VNALVNCTLCDFSLFTQHGTQQTLELYTTKTLGELPLVNGWISWRET